MAGKLFEAARALMPHNYILRRTPASTRYSPEYLVRLRACRNKSEHGYRTNDLTDAVNTAWHLAQCSAPCCAQLEPEECILCNTRHEAVCCPIKEESE